MLKNQGKGGTVMFDGCNWSSDWLECLDCKFLSLPACPLEGSDAIDKIANRIQAMEFRNGGASGQDTLAPALDKLNNETPMHIKIMYHDESLDMVAPRHLAELIISQKIKRFLRTEGWVTVGIDPIRGQGGAYYGPERRKRVD
jgi:hypothetical protein